MIRFALKNLAKSTLRVITALLVCTLIFFAWTEYLNYKKWENVKTMCSSIEPGMSIDRVSMEIARHGGKLRLSEHQKPKAQFSICGCSLDVNNNNIVAKVDEAICVD